MASASKLPEHTMLSASEQLELPRSAKVWFPIFFNIKNQNLKCSLKNVFVDILGSMINIISICFFAIKEMWNCPKISLPNSLRTLTMMMQIEAASCHGITIVGGSVPEWSNGRLYNTSCVFGPDGQSIGKILDGESICSLQMHLFDVDIPGDITLKESDIFTAGDKPTIVDRGQQIARDSCSGYAIWGQYSTLVGLSGEIIATSGHEENVIVAEIDYSKIELQRKSLPLDKQKRGDIYQFVDECEEQKHQKNEPYEEEIHSQ
ncbi:omega-amidase, chloroplastic-like [Juglans regia]|uniref:Omega-amidase, chloroplastic-like n=1 Tax=Juglans regia TaxID=51240 RepID=A0A6P9EIY6_JUGRE|nr:omega-amidase, chloroplastic-like [Juglans regia]